MELQKIRGIGKAKRGHSHHPDLNGYSKVQDGGDCPQITVYGRFRDFFPRILTISSIDVDVTSPRGLPRR